jgi:hypothetical protein
MLLVLPMSLLSLPHISQNAAQQILLPDAPHYFQFRELCNRLLLVVRLKDMHASLESALVWEKSILDTLVSSFPFKSHTSQEKQGVTKQRRPLS